MDCLLKLAKEYKTISAAPYFSRSSVDSLWDKYLEKETPMGSLLLDNDFVSQINKKSDLILLHVTPKLEEIKKDKILFSSGGGLGGVIYCTPVHSDGSPHNLTDYIMKKELPKFIGLNLLESPSVKTNLTAIKIPGKLLSTDSLSIVRLNYVEFGKDYLKSYDRLVKKGKISDSKNQQISKSLEVEFRRLKPFLELFCPNKYNLSMDKFLKLLEIYLPKSEMLLNCYFEVILEYFYMHQDSRIAIRDKNRGEMNNELVKDMVFTLAPELYTGFSTRKFKVKPSDFIDYFDDKTHEPYPITKFDPTHFNLFLRWRLSYYIFILMLNGAPINDNRYLSDDITKIYPNLSGQLKYKIMQNEDSHLMESEFSSFFLRTSPGLSIVSYKNIPKGEIGLRVNRNNSDIKLFSAHINDEHKVILDEKIKVTFSNRLIKPQDGIMRQPNSFCQNNTPPLYIMAKSKSLGSLQLMDLPTLYWIARGSSAFAKPLFKKAFLYHKDIEILKKYFPKQVWFLSRSHIDSIHGQRHIWRVSLFALLLCNLLSVSEEIKYSSFVASIAHDLRRLNDNQDEQHGKRAARWLKENADLFKDIVKKSNMGSALFAIRYHNSTPNIKNTDINGDYEMVINILKTADALDRFRQPKKKWWINPEMLKIKSAAKIISLARFITLRTEEDCLNGVDIQKSMLDAIVSSKVAIRGGDNDK